MIFWFIVQKYNFSNIIYIVYMKKYEKYNYVIYHKRCFDGFTGFLILHQSKQIDRHALIYPDVPSATSIPQSLEGKNVIIIDCAYKYNILKEIVRKAKHVTFIDHHITIYEDILKLYHSRPNDYNWDKLKIPNKNLPKFGPKGGGIKEEFTLEKLDTYFNRKLPINIDNIENSKDFLSEIISKIKKIENQK